jgi:hypothetical protein
MNRSFNIFVLVLVVSVNSFPDGAPPDTCVKDRFNQPNHGQFRAQPLETLPYKIQASSAFYKPGDTISCKQNIKKTRKSLLNLHF